MNRNTAPIAHCACCLATFPPDEGKQGDKCPLCGWECDKLETETIVNGTPVDDWSWANGAMLSMFRTAWFHSVACDMQRAFCVRAMIKKRNEVWQKLDQGMPSSQVG